MTPTNINGDVMASTVFDEVITQWFDKPKYHFRKIKKLNINGKNITKVNSVVLMGMVNSTPIINA